MKFSIRDLLLVTVIVALAVGWWVDRSRLTSKASLEAWDIEHFQGEIKVQRAQIKELKELLLHSSPPAPNPSKP